MTFLVKSSITAGIAVAVLGSTLLPTSHHDGGLTLTGLGVGWAAAVALHYWEAVRSRRSRVVAPVAEVRRSDGVSLP